ncbi:MAG: translocation/assembly module TamB domain-containing protein, partial [Candidatus Kapaibacterium sp.]
ITRRDKFQVMSEATAATSDFMYGRTLISTQDNDADRTLRQLHFHGTPDQPLLNGFVMIEDADVKFPPTINKASRASTFEYLRVGNRYVWSESERKTVRSDSSIGDLPPEEPSPRTGSVKLGKSFTDILRTEVDVKIASNMSVQMDFGFNDQLLAVVRQDNPKDAMRFIRLGSDSTSLRSDLIVDNSSTYKFYETFRASGKMNINGPIDNPRLDLRAMLNNERVVNDKKSNYKVYLNITGTKKKPVLKLDYEIDGNDHPGTVGETEITTNAVLLLLFGYTQVELSGSAGSATGAVGTKLGASTLGVLLNRVLQGGVIKNVNVDFSGGGTDFSQARIQITAGLYGANVTLGGTVADPTITLDWALGEFIGANWVTQFMRATNPGATISRQQKQWEVRVGATVP